MAAPRPEGLFTSQQMAMAECTDGGRGGGCARYVCPCRCGICIPWPMEDAARAVRAVQGQVPTPGNLPPYIPTSLGTQPLGYLGRWVPTLGGLGT